MPDKRVHGIGLAAFVKMHGFKISDVRRTHICFACQTDADWKRIQDLELEYANSEFAKFDSMVVDLKSLPGVDANTVDPRIQIVDNLGQAAYLLMAKLAQTQWTIVGKSRGGYVFEVRPEEQESFDAKRIAWANSKFRDFNQEIRTIMSLRKRGPDSRT